MMEAESMEEQRALAKKSFDGEKWEIAAEHFVELYDAGCITPEEIIMFGVSVSNCGELDIATHLLTKETLRVATNVGLVRTLVVAKAMKKKDFSTAETMLRILVDAYPDDVKNMASLASVLIRDGRRKEAAQVLERACACDPDNTLVKNQLLLSYLQNNNLTNACKLAEDGEGLWIKDIRFAQLSLMALNRNGLTEKAERAAEVIAAAENASVEAVTLAAQHFLDMKKYDLASNLCEKSISGGKDGTRLRFLAASALANSQEQRKKAMSHLQRAISIDDADLKSHLLMADLLMKDGAPRSAAKHFKIASKLAPDSIHARVGLGQALKFSRKFQEAATVFCEVSEMTGGSADSWQRLTISTLSQAGLEQEAREMYRKYKNTKRSKLPNSIQQGLRFLNSRLDNIKIPQARLDWAYEIYERQIGASELLNRKDWEKKVKWGFGADKLIADWLEVKSEHRDDVAEIFHNLDKAGVILNDLMKKGNGLLIASAHVGPLYAGPLALHKLGIRNKWLASTPQIASPIYDETLISTSDQTEIEVVGKVYKALSDQYAVTIAVDGALNPAAPTIEFEGKTITYSDFVPRTSHRLGVPTVFAAPIWNGNKIEFYLKSLPGPDHNESVESFVSRWEDEFFDIIRGFFLLGPESLRLSGGLWRNVK